MDMTGIPVESLLAAAREAGIHRAVNVGCDLPSSRWSVDAALAHPDVYAAVAIHPNDVAAVDSARDEVLAEIESLASSPRTVAIGETGLDYYRDHSAPEVQRWWFRAHIEIARRLGKPVMIHDRDAHEDVLAILAEYAPWPPYSVIFHCFSGDEAMAARCGEAGYVMSFAGNVTFKNASPLRAAAAVAPPGLMLAETDAPFLTPVPHRGKPNSPAMTAHTIRFLAELKSLDLADFCGTLQSTGQRVFGWLCAREQSAVHGKCAFDRTHTWSSMRLTREDRHGERPPPHAERAQMRNRCRTRCRPNVPERAIAHVSQRAQMRNRCRYSEPECAIGLAVSVMAVGVRLLGVGDIRDIAGRLGVRPTKKLGQNFVVEQGTVRQIAALAAPRRGDVILEVGPGLGSLTLALLEAAADTGGHLVAVEIDPVLAAELPRTIAERAPAAADRVTVVTADALHVGEPEAGQPTVLAANLPYNVAVPVVLHLLATFPSLARGVVMVQAEVADRMCAQPGSRVYGVPSAKLAWYAAARPAGTVPRSVFWPVPNVDSKLISFTRHQPPDGADRRDTFAVIDAAFGQRRKTLRAALAGWAGSAAEAERLLRAAAVDPGARGEALGVADFARIARARRESGLSAAETKYDS
jgi:16S rRNA (adenine1518-N6/adenine1519-N6)-dimethyltransferase